jgi:glutamate-1-semialdehyde 2,1-aminomutase
MLAESFYFACSLYETGFISTATTDEMIEDTIKASAKVFKEIANG